MHSQLIKNSGASLATRISTTEAIKAKYITADSDAPVALAPNWSPMKFLTKREIGK